MTGRSGTGGEVAVSLHGRWTWLRGATEPPEGRKGAVFVVVWGGLAGRGQISKARLLGHGTHPQSPPVLRQGEEMRRERVFDFMSRFSRNFPGRNFLYLAQKIHGGLCGGGRGLADAVS